jgi:hypothetical protein
MDNFKKYLPSRKFIATLLVIIIFIALFFTVKEVISLLQKRKKGVTLGNKSTLIETTPASLIQKDSNNNGIPDYEEYMWGLDPTKNGPENKEYILAKKKALVDSGDITTADDSQTITDNDILARQFLATIVSLQQTGELDSDSINSVSEALGKNIEATPIADVYTRNMMTVESDSSAANKAYSTALTSLINSYSDADIGSELTFIIQGLSNKDPQALYAATTVAVAYQTFGQKLIKIPVPQSLAAIVLSMANNYEKTGESIKDLSKMLTDPITAMKAIINYKNYSDALANDLEKLSGALQ